MLAVGVRLFAVSNELDTRRRSRKDATPPQHTADNTPGRARRDGLELARIVAYDVSGRAGTTLLGKMDLGKTEVDVNGMVHDPATNYLYVVPCPKNTPPFF